MQQRLRLEFELAQAALGGLGSLAEFQAAVVSLGNAADLAAQQIRNFNQVASRLRFPRHPYPNPYAK